MTEIKPFKAIIYNKQKVRNLSNVVCPPYDVISDTEKESLNKLDDFNFIKLLLSKPALKESGQHLDKYKNAKLIFSSWLKDGVLISDKKEGIYFYFQEFMVKGEKKSRVGFIALMRLSETGKTAVHPHEFTRQAPKDDRLALLKSVRANLSPIFTLFSDVDRQVTRIFDNYISKQVPLLEVKDRNGEIHKIWRLEDATLVKRLKDYMKDKDVVIADGHHRYEVACEFKNAMLRRRGRTPKSRLVDFNYIMAYFIDMNSRGLTVLPTHRLVRKMPKNALEKIGEFFVIEKVPDRFALSFLLTKAATSTHAFGLYAGGSFYLLRLKKECMNDKFIVGDSDLYNSLDVVVLNKLILDRLLSVDLSSLEFIKEEDEAIELVDKGNFSAVFFLSATKVEQIRNIALNNERMPPKSTYFYPKLLSGLLVHKF